MNGTLHHHDIHRHIVGRHQHEARELARSESLGREARSARERFTEHGPGGRLMFVAAPMLAVVAAMGLGVALL